MEPPPPIQPLRSPADPAETSEASAPTALPLSPAPADLSPRVDSATFEIFRAHSDNPDPHAAVQELKQQIGTGDVEALLFFCSSAYDRTSLSDAFEAAFIGDVVGCTTAGEISANGFGERGVSAVAFSGAGIRCRQYVLNPLEDLAKQVQVLSERIDEQLQNPDAGKNAFALLLVDGLSGKEEQVTAYLSNALRGVPLIGGSAGDDMTFARTHVYAAGDFHTDAAVLTVFQTDAPVHTFRTQHFVPSDRKLVVTGAIAECRIVTEINGEPAAWEYARSIGLEVRELEPMIFSKHPVMLSIGGEYFVRSIQRVNDDGSLTFFCAIDEGLVLTVAESVDLVENLRQALTGVRAAIPQPRVILGCDCVLRRVEMREKGLLEEVGRIMNDHRVVGFSTYGEQIDSIHVNQTFTGVAIG